MTEAIQPLLPVTPEDIAGIFDALEQWMRDNNDLPASTRGWREQMAEDPKSQATAEAFIRIVREHDRQSHSLPGDVGKDRLSQIIAEARDDWHDGPIGSMPDYIAEQILAALTPSALSEKVVKPGFQAEVGDWMLECFGPEIASDRLERGDRWTEEALELAQTIPGFTAERAHALVDYVFARPVGERGQEVGGSMVTLAALCNSFGLNIAEEAERELARVWTKVEAIRAKQAAKPTGSALPVAVPSALSGDAGEGQ